MKAKFEFIFGAAITLILLVCFIGLMLQPAHCSAGLALSINFAIVCGLIVPTLLVSGILAYEWINDNISLN